MKTTKRLPNLFFAALLALLVFTTGCFNFNASFSTANITNAVMTESVNSDGIPGDAVSSFPANAPILYTSAELHNAPNNTQIRIVWAYVTGKQIMDEVTFDSGDLSDRYIYSYFEPTELLPEGDYRVDYYIGNHKKPDASVNFTVAAAEEAPAASGAAISDAHMTSYIEEGGEPADTISVVPTTGTWYVSAILSNTQPGTILHFTWYDLDGSVVDTVDVDPQGATDVYVFSSLELTGTASEGDYQVAIFVDDQTDPAAVVTFTASNNA